MLQAIFGQILRTLRTDRGREHHRRKPARRLSLERLECRKLLSATARFSGLSDGNFEAPALAAGAYQISGNGSPWQVSGIAGISSNGSGFTDGNPKAPQGTQVALIKNNASLSQTIYLTAGVYTISFQAAQRYNYQTQNQQIEVLIDGGVVGAAVPASINYAPYQTGNFPVASGTHTVQFLGMSPSGNDSTAFIDSVVINSVVNTLLDAGFEQPSLPTNGFQTAPSGLPWQFSGTAGVSSNGSAFVANSTVSQVAPEGTQVGYIQQTGSISQTTYLDAGTYQVSVLAAQRAFYQSNYQEIEVLLDGAQAGVIDPTGIQYASYQTTSFTVAAGPHTIKLLGMNPLGGDNTAFIDQVTITAANPVDDASFETPALAAGTYQLTPGGTSWQYSGGTGVSSNGSSFTSGNPNAPKGTQVAFINGTGSMSQSMPLSGGSYNLSFLAAQRANVQTANQQIQVLFDGSQVGLVTPLGTSYSLYRTLNFTAVAGPHTIKFVGVNPQGGNNTALIGEVTIETTKNVIIDGGFETPALAASSYQLTPSGLPWQFSDAAGISTNNSDFTYGSATVPQGSQVAFIKNGGRMTYLAYLDTGGYNLSFLAAQRSVYQTQSQQIQVSVDGTPLGVIVPNTTSYGPCQTANFSVTAGMHTIEFLGLSPASADSTGFIDQVAIANVTGSLSDGSFETPVLSASTFQVAPSGSAWQFTVSAGVSTNGSGFTAGNANAPDGAQVAFIKNGGGISQSVYLDAGTYCLSFQAAQRVNYQSQNQQLQILIDGSAIGTVTPSSTTYALCQAPNFTVAAGTHTIKIAGMGPASGDSTALIDSATLSMGSAVGDGSFEASVLAAGSYTFAPSGTPWQFAGAAGVSTNVSAFTIGNPNAPDGVQVAFLKDHGSISQSIYMDAGLYNLSFAAAQRAYSQSQYQSLEVLVDGAVVSDVIPSGTSYGLYQTSNFTVAAGIHTIRIAGLNPLGGDNTAFIDAVHFS
jgi:hypothetical protein